MTTELQAFAWALDRILVTPKTCQVEYARSSEDDAEPCGHAGIAQCADCGIWLCKRCRVECGQDVLCNPCFDGRIRDRQLRCLVCQRVSEQPFCELCQQSA